MREIIEIVNLAQNEFSKRLEEIKKDGGLTLDRYVRYLSMQYHLTKGVQRHFLIAASHPDLAHRLNLRKFLFDFAIVEEPHFEIAYRDLESLNKAPLEEPLDVKLWWSFFNDRVYDRPFIRLGATCILENIAGKSGDLITELFQAAKYLTPRNSRFFTIHRHDENLPHGDQILEALSTAHLDPNHLQDLKEGAEIGRILYLRLVHWALSGTCSY